MHQLSQLPPAIVATPVGAAVHFSIAPDASSSDREQAEQFLEDTCIHSPCSRTARVTVESDLELEFGPCGHPGTPPWESCVVPGCTGIVDYYLAVPRQITIASTHSEGDGYEPSEVSATFALTGEDQAVHPHPVAEARYPAPATFHPDTDDIRMVSGRDTVAICNTNQFSHEHDRDGYFLGATTLPRSQPMTRADLLADFSSWTNLSVDDLNRLVALGSGVLLLERPMGNRLSLRFEHDQE